jgi:hypothetical protein
MSQKFCDHTILTGVLLPIRQHGLSKSFITFSLLQQCGLHSRRSSFQGPSGGEATRNQDRLPCSQQPHRHNAVKRSGPHVAYTEYRLGIGTKGTDRAGSCGSVMERWFITSFSRFPDLTAVSRPPHSGFSIRTPTSSKNAGQERQHGRRQATQHQQRQQQCRLSSLGQVSRIESSCRWSIVRGDGSNSAADRRSWGRSNRNPSCIYACPGAA